MDQPNEQEWMRWSIIERMNEGAKYGDFTQSEIEETKMAFGLTEKRDEQVGQY